MRFGVGNLWSNYRSHCKGIIHPPRRGWELPLDPFRNGPLNRGYVHFKEFTQCKEFEPANKNVPSKFVYGKGTKRKRISLAAILIAFKERRLSDVKTIYDDAQNQGLDLDITVENIHQTYERPNGKRAQKEFKIVQFLIRHGYDVHATDEKDRTLLRLVIKASRWDLNWIKMLLKSGADIDARDHECRTPLYYAIQESDPSDDILRLLVEAGADVNRSCSKNCETPLMICIQSGRFQNLCEYLLQSGANVNAADKFGRTALHRIVDEQSYSFHMVELLCRYGADATIKDNDGFDAVQLAVYRCCTQPRHRELHPAHKELYSQSLHEFKKLLNLVSYPLDKRADAYHFLGCFLLIHSCCIITHSFEEYDHKDYEREYQKVLFAKEYPIGYFHAYQKFVQGVQMWKKAEEIRSDQGSFYRDWEEIIRNPDQILLQVIRRFETLFRPKHILEMYTEYEMFSNDFRIPRFEVQSRLLKEFDELYDYMIPLSGRRLRDYYREVFEENLTIDVVILMSLTIPRKEVTRYSKPMQKFLRVDWEETDASETYQFLAQEGPDLLPTDLKLLNLGIENFMRLYLRNYFTLEFDFFFWEVSSQMFQCGLHSQLMRKLQVLGKWNEAGQEEKIDSIKCELASIFQRFWNNYWTPSADTYSYMT